MKVLDNFYIDGQWVPSSGDSHVEVTDSATEEVIARVAEGTSADVDAAVAAAKAAFATWSTTPERRAGMAAPESRATTGSMPVPTNGASARRSGTA